MRRPEYQIKAEAANEKAVGLRTWEAVLDAKGYIPTGLGAGGCGAGFDRDELSDCGGYAHLISAASLWLVYLQGKTDWAPHGVPPVPAVRV